MMKIQKQTDGIISYR